MISKVLVRCFNAIKGVLGMAPDIILSASACTRLNFLALVSVWVDLIGSTPQFDLYRKPASSVNPFAIQFCDFTDLQVQLQYLHSTVVHYLILLSLSSYCETWHIRKINNFVNSLHCTISPNLHSLYTY